MCCNSEKIILITGCTSGIGLETAKYLYESGYKLLLIGRDEEKLKNLSCLLNEMPFFVCNLNEIESIKNIFAFCQEGNIKLSGMVHSAGYAVNMPIKAFKIEDMERQMTVHYYAFLELCKYFSSKKVSLDNSSIVALSSLASMTKRRMSTLYAASKSALNVAVSVAAKEFAKRGIRVNSLMPAYVDTRMNAGLEDLIDVRERQPMGLIPPKEIAYLIEFLLSDKSRYITGANIPISAGMDF